MHSIHSNRDYQLILGRVQNSHKKDSTTTIITNAENREKKQRRHDDAAQQQNIATSRAFMRPRLRTHARTLRPLDSSIILVKQHNKTIKNSNSNRYSVRFDRTDTNAAMGTRYKAKQRVETFFFSIPFVPIQLIRTTMVYAYLCILIQRFVKPKSISQFEFDAKEARSTTSYKKCIGNSETTQEYVTPATDGPTYGTRTRRM